MSDDRRGKFVDRLKKAFPDESREAFPFFLLFFLITCPAYINKTVKEALLISNVRPAWWSYADLMTAALIGLVVAFNARLLNRLPRRSYISATLVFFMTNLFVFWLIFDFEAKTLVQTPIQTSGGYLWMIPVWWGIQRLGGAIPVVSFSFWADVFIATSVTHYWIAVNDFYFPHQAKRMVRFFIGGGLLGGGAGALASLLLARSIGTENLLLLSLGTLVLTLVTVNIIYAERQKLPDSPQREASPARTGGGFFESLKAVLTRRYLRLIAGLLATSMIVGTLIGYQFKTVILASIKDRDGRTAFLGVFYILLLGLSALLHFLLTDRVLRKKNGIRLALSIPPLVLLAVSVSSFLIPAAGLIAWALLLRGGDKVFDNTFSQSGRELLYVPLPSKVKYKAKIFIDLFVNKLATACGAVLFLALYHVLQFREKLVFDRDIAYTDIPRLLRQVSGPLQVISVPIIVFTLIWIGLAFLARREHHRTIVDGIEDLWPDVQKSLSRQVDLESARSLVETVQSLEKSPTLFILNLFSVLQRQRLSPQLKEFLIELIRQDRLSPEIRELLSSMPGEAGFHSGGSLFEVGGEVLLPQVEHPSTGEDLETTILRVLQNEDFIRVMEEYIHKVVADGSGNNVEKEEVAKLMGRLEPTPGLVRNLGILIRDPSADVRHYALESAGIHRREEHLPLIIEQLGDAAVRATAQEALIRYGARIEPQLQNALSNRRKDAALRRAVPEILAGLGTQNSADILLSELSEGNEDLEEELVDALYKIRLDRPELLFDERRVRTLVLALSRRSQHILGKPRPAVDEKGHTIRIARLRIQFNRIFNLLALIHPPEEIVKAYQNIIEGTKGTADFALALLDNILDGEIKSALFPLIDYFLAGKGPTA